MSISVIGAALEALAEKNDGRLTPAIVVAAAANPDSPLHEYFTWNDTDAARLHRENEARTLIRSVRVEIRTQAFSVQAPFFIRDPEAAAKEPGYTSLARLRTDEALAREAVIAEFSRASSALARAKAVAAALELTDEIEALQGGLHALTERVRLPA